MPRDTDGNEFPLVDFREGASSDAEVAWKQNLVTVHHKIEESNLPEELKKLIKINLDQLLTSAGMTFITMGQIGDLLRKWDLSMHVLKISHPHFVTPEFLVFKKTIRMELELQLNKSREGWQGNHAFETRVKYDVRQTQESFTERLGRFFGRGKHKKIIEEKEI